jgi:alpha-amylase
VMLNDGSTTKTKTVTTPFINATLTDKTGNTTGTVTTNASGVGTFSVNSRNYAVWVPGAVTGGGTNTAVTFNVNYSGTTVGQEVYVVGSTAQLGAWNTTNAIKLSGTAFPTWTKLVNLTSGTAVQYKYIRKDANGANVLYEGGANRTFTPTGASQTRNDTWQP